MQDIDLSGYLGYTVYMINDGINDVPDKTIAIFTSPRIYDQELSQDRILGMVKKSDKKRDWFSPHFYRCLPLTIGNQYGFTVSSEFDIGFEWNGQDGNEDTKIYVDDKIVAPEYLNSPILKRNSKVEVIPLILGSAEQIIIGLILLAISTGIQMLITKLLNFFY